LYRSGGSFHRVILWLTAYVETSAGYMTILDNLFLITRSFLFKHTKITALLEFNGGFIEKRCRIVQNRTHQIQG